MQHRGRCRLFFAAVGSSKTTVRAVVTHRARYRDELLVRRLEIADGHRRVRIQPHRSNRRFVSAFSVCQPIAVRQELGTAAKDRRFAHAHVRCEVEVLTAEADAQSADPLGAAQPDELAVDGQITRVRLVGHARIFKGVDLPRTVLTRQRMHASGSDGERRLFNLELPRRGAC